MSYRMTLVLEYENERDAPAIGPHTRDLGPFKVYAVQFADALLELEVLEEYVRPCDWDAAQNDPRLQTQRRPINGGCSTDGR
jgi:hypothetical protein